LDVPRWNANLKPVFGELTVKQLTKGVLSDYTAARKKAGAANATVNKEINILRTAFNHAEIIPPVKWPRLQESNVRTGFLPDDKQVPLEQECAKVGLWLRAMLAVAIDYGWRKAELMLLKVSQVDLLEKTVRLEPGTTKNDEGRTVLLNQKCFELVKACALGKTPEQYLFTYSDGSPVFRMEQGRPVATWRKTWKAVTKAAGVEGLHFHSLRRTSARNNRRLGVPENVIMKLSGWKTASMFKRYSIVSTDDQKDVVRLHDAKRIQSQSDTEKPESVAKGNSSYRTDTVDTASTQSGKSKLLN
jgi:integrase